jgi:hypothetical protein
LGKNVPTVGDAATTKLTVPLRRPRTKYVDMIDVTPQARRSGARMISQEVPPVAGTLSR